MVDPRDIDGDESEAKRGPVSSRSITTRAAARDAFRGLPTHGALAIARIAERSHFPFARPAAQRRALLALTVAILGFAALDAMVILPIATTYEGGAAVGMDLRTYVDRTNDWLAGEGFYRPRQLGGVPYEIQTDDSFYPPTLLYILVPFALGLPAILWWVIPCAIIALSIARIRPPLWTWPLMAFVLLLPGTPLVLVLGNPSMWAIAAAFAGVAWGWPAVLVLLKLTLAPVALIGIRRRAWWVALGVLALVSLPFGAMWIDYASALMDAQNTRGLDYVLADWSLMLAPLAAWVGSAVRGSPPD